MALTDGTKCKLLSCRLNLYINDNCRTEFFIILSQKQLLNISLQPWDFYLILLLILPSAVTNIYSVHTMEHTLNEGLYLCPLILAHEVDTVTIYYPCHFKDWETAAKRNQITCSGSHSS